MEKSYKASWPDGITLLQDLAADERAFRKHAPHHRYVHIATHGFFAPAEIKSALGSRDTARGSSTGNVFGIRTGLPSGLALADANRPWTDSDDGILTAEEAETLDLVVLSAC